jgi:membrane protein YdbS with pleckstrin-like domain
MFEALRARLLRFLRVPHEPVPPFGAPGSVRVFRAGRNYRKILLVRWGVAQAGAFAGLLFGLFWFSLFHDQFEIARQTPAPASVAPTPPPAQPEATVKPVKRSKGGKSDWNHLTRELAVRTPGWLFTLLVLAEAIGVLLFVFQFVATLIAVRLEFEQHWYIVTDRSLRIRTGLFRVQESTMSFANIQQVVVSQGPLQRLLGLADVQVQSAGGGGADEHNPGADASLHTGVFHGVANAAEIRDLILDRLRAFRATGLGDPDDHGSPAPVPAAPFPPAASSADTLAAARELLVEARELRRTLSPA